MLPSYRLSIGLVTSAIVGIQTIIGDLVIKNVDMDSQNPQRQRQSAATFVKLRFPSTAKQTKGNCRDTNSIDRYWFCSAYHRHVNRTRNGQEKATQLPASDEGM